MSQEKKLTKNALNKYRQIIDEWFNNDFNGKQAYLKFYTNVKDDTASTNFSKIQQYPEVKEYINEKYNEAQRFQCFLSYPLLNYKLHGLLS